MSNEEYYKSLTDFLRNIITALFVALLGLIGYFFTHDCNILAFIGIVIDSVIMFIIF